MQRTRRTVRQAAAPHRVAHGLLPRNGGARPAHAGADRVCQAAAGDVHLLPQPDEEDRVAHVRRQRPALQPGGGECVHQLHKRRAAGRVRLGF